MFPFGHSKSDKGVYRAGAAGMSYEDNIKYLGLNVGEEANTGSSEHFS